MSPSDPILVNYVPGDMTETFVQEVHSFIQEFVDRRQLLPRSFEEVEKLAEHSFGQSGRSFGWVCCAGGLFAQTKRNSMSRSGFAVSQIGYCQ